MGLQDKGSVGSVCISSKAAAACCCGSMPQHVKRVIALLCMPAYMYICMFQSRSRTDTSQRGVICVWVCVYSILEILGDTISDTLDLMLR